MTRTANVIAPAVSPFSANQNARPRRRFHIIDGALTHHSTRSATYDAGTNGKGHLTSMTDATGSTTWTYDINGNAATKSQVTGTVTLTVDYNRGSGSELLTSMEYPSTRTVSYTYDTDKRIAGITSTSTLVASAAYFPFGPATGWTQYGSVAYGRPLDQDGRVSSVNIGGTTNVQTLTYDLASRLTGLTETGLSAKSYGYDNANRLTSLTIGSASPTTYTYDANGNRTSVTDPSSNVTTYNYPGTSNKLSSLSGYVAETLSYDAAGNETGDGTNTYAYNARGRMSSVTVGGVTTTYGVNGLGERVTKSGTGVGGGGTNEYVYDEQGHLLGEYNSTGQRIEETVWLNNAPAAVMIGTGTPTFYAVSPDWQNTPHVVANSAGTFAWTWDRLGFGDSAPNQNPGGLGTFVYNLRFPGQLSDVESSLNYNMARDYNPVFGRYIQSDPIGLRGGINTYGYVAGNPFEYTDGLGLVPNVSLGPRCWNDVGYCPAPVKKSKIGGGDQAGPQLTLISDPVANDYNINWVGLSSDTISYILSNHGASATGAKKSTFSPVYSTPEALRDLATNAMANGQMTARGVPPGSDGYVYTATIPGTVGNDAYTGPTSRYVVYTSPVATINIGGLSVAIRQVTNIFPRASGQ